MGDVSGICAKISFSVDLFLAGKLQNIESKLNKMTYEVIRKTFWSDMKVTGKRKEKNKQKITHWELSKTTYWGPIWEMSWSEMKAT